MKRNTKKNDVRFEFEPNDEDFELMKVIGDKSVGECKGQRRNNHVGNTPRNPQNGIALF